MPHENHDEIGPLVYGVRDDELIHVSLVSSGLECGCRCPSCNSRLVAKKGKIIIEHFAHEGGNNCAAAYETQIHLLAKKILSESDNIILPPQIPIFESILYKSTYRYPPDSLAGYWINIERVIAECRFGEIIPDIIIEHDGGQELLVEIFVTHKVDEEKKNKLISMDIPSIEIDFSNIRFDNVNPEETIRDLIINNPGIKRWLYVKDKEKKSRLMSRYIQIRQIDSRDQWVSACPRVNEFQELKEDKILPCDHCSYHLIDTNGFINRYSTSIVCIGDYGIISEEDLVKRISDYIMHYLIDDNCYMCSCGGEIVLRNGPYGLFWGCDNFPYCRFSRSYQSIDNETREYYESHSSLCCPQCGNQLLWRPFQEAIVSCPSSDCNYEIKFKKK